MTSRVLFILKRRPDYNPETHSKIGLSTGLYNSANFMKEMLVEAGIESHLEVAIDNNCIDRMVRNYKPTHVIIEALWVVPSKFEVLIKLHPKVKWIVRLHSEMPFIASEGIAMDWLPDYARHANVSIGVNAPRMLEETQQYLKTARNWSENETNHRVFYLPNYYPTQYHKKKFNRDKYWVDVACFGAVRPLKNHLVQAHAAMQFANKINKQLRFHINIGRIEMKGDPILNNLKGMFQHLADVDHQMIMHEWTPRDNFLKICREMDIGLQCNFSETFNIVSADLISQGVPVVGSKEIPWATSLYNADPTSSKQICDKMFLAYHLPGLNVNLNQKKLNKYTEKTKKVWVNYFSSRE